MKRFYIKLLLTLLLCFTICCEIDHGIAPLPGKLIATVIFRNTPPEDTQGIYLVVAPEFPPHAINELFHSPNSLPIDKDTVITEMALPFGSYDAVSLWWYSTDTKSNLADILALPLDVNNNLMPLSFEITPEEPVFNIELYANWKRVERTASIEGTVTFNGDFPENTMATAVAAYQFEPQESVQYLLWLKSIDFSIDKNPYHYKLPVTRGSVNYVAVFWLPEKAALTDFRVLGVYKNPADTTLNGTIYIRENETVTDIDIFADWSKIKRE